VDDLVRKLANLITPEADGRSPLSKAVSLTMKKDEAAEPKFDEVISDRKGEPSDQDLYDKVIESAKRKFDVYPSAYANAWAVQEYKRRGGTYHKPAKKASASETFTPPKGVQEEGQRAVAWIKDGHAGGGFTAVGRRRASDLAAGRAVSLDTIKRMSSYLARHAVDEQGKGWSPGEDGYPSPGRVAWAAWGGDRAVAWTRGILASAQD
jgi:hypothetical protein